jgi:hypothetical protein
VALDYARLVKPVKNFKSCCPDYQRVRNIKVSILGRHGLDRAKEVCAEAAEETTVKVNRYSSRAAKSTMIDVRLAFPEVSNEHAKLHKLVDFGWLMKIAVPRPARSFLRDRWSFESLKRR